MSWHFSQALVEEFSQATCWDGEPFALLSENPTLGTYCWRDSATESCDLFQSGMTCGPSTGDLGAELLTWYRAGFPALTSASPAPCGAGMELQESPAASGPNTCASLTKSSQSTFGGRTAPSCGSKGLPRSFETWPPVGMYADGQLSALTTLGSPTSANASGSSLPTPTARDWKDTAGMALERKDGKTRTDRLPMLLFSVVRSAGIEWKSQTATDARTVTVKGWPVLVTGPHYSPSLPEWIMGWPPGWTDLQPLETDRFLLWQRLRGNPFTELNTPKPIAMGE